MSQSNLGSGSLLSATLPLHLANAKSTVVQAQGEAEKNLSQIKLLLSTPDLIDQYLEILRNELKKATIENFDDKKSRPNDKIFYENEIINKLQNLRKSISKVGQMLPKLEEAIKTGEYDKKFQEEIFCEIKTSVKNFKDIRLDIQSLISSLPKIPLTESEEFRNKNLYRGHLRGLNNLEIAQYLEGLNPDKKIQNINHAMESLTPILTAMEQAGINPNPAGKEVSSARLENGKVVPNSGRVHG
jgi:hypothetical protein